MVDRHAKDIPDTPPRAYRDRQPRRAMDEDDVREILDRIEEAGVTVWIDGGWGVDALLGEKMREHDDLDLVVELGDVPNLIVTLTSHGYELVVGSPPTSFVLVDPVGRQIDVHPVAFDSGGGGVYRMEDGRDWVYPAAGFAGRGRIGGRPVLCLTAEVQVLVHAGYELTEKDYRELRQLYERFGVELQPKMLARVLAARDPR